MDFIECFDKLIGHEGGYTSNQKDRGNWTTGVVGKGECRGTKYGISAMSYPTLDIVNLSLDDARSIYKKDFWDKLKLDKLPNEICFDLFDTAINSGISRAIKILQETVGAEQDGVIGDKTITLSFKVEDLKYKYNANRLLFMTSLSSWDTFGKGWARRVANNILTSYR